MSLGVIFKGPEGIAVAADSIITLQSVTGQVITQFFYDNATKVMSIVGQQFAGVLTVGLEVLGTDKPRTVGSFIPEFEKTLSKAARMPIKDLASQLGQFFLLRWKEAALPNNTENIIFYVMGYNEGEAYGRIYKIVIPSTISAYPVDADTHQG